MNGFANKEQLDPDMTQADQPAQYHSQSDLVNQLLRGWLQWFILEAELSEIITISSNQKVFSI